ncbi:MAG: bifunctional UDP-N-acetylglucosamine pyrophosphorylase / glucosamine-phosphate N-acetyltransferase, partial [Mycobacterium sp.]|nr:bifunctional UDP-N-acetylglucosamine pyrophosphorylase / glucosamine-phosphate N-acetyltransferase [Mycobacterium sp.]
MTFRGDTAVLVLAAGPGTRMRSDTPKVLHTIGGRSMLSHSLHAMTKLAPQHLVVVLGHGHQRISPLVAELADSLGRTIDVALQDEPLGTGHAVLCGLSALPEDYAGIVVVAACDTPLLDADTLADLIATHSAAEHGQGAAVTVLTTTLDDPHGYGRILRTQDNEVMAIVEQTDATTSQRGIREVNTGVYAFDIAALRSALSRLSSNNAQQELYLTDVIAILRRDGQTVSARHIDDSAVVAGINNRVQLAELGAELNRRIVATHQLAGVTVVDPASTWIDVDVTIGRDTVIHPGTQLLGRTQIGGRCIVGPDTTLNDVQVGNSATVCRTHGTSATIGDGASVGPFTF